MNKAIIFILLVVGIVFVDGCAQQIPRVDDEKLTAPKPALEFVELSWGEDANNRPRLVIKIFENRTAYVFSTDRYGEPHPGSFLELTKKEFGAFQDYFTQKNFTLLHPDDAPYVQGTIRYKLILQIYGKSKKFEWTDNMNVSPLLKKLPLMFERNILGDPQFIPNPPEIDPKIEEQIETFRQQIESFRPDEFIIKYSVHPIGAPITGPPRVVNYEVIIDENGRIFAIFDHFGGFNDFRSTAELQKGQLTGEELQSLIGLLRNKILSHPPIEPALAYPSHFTYLTFSINLDNATRNVTIREGADITPEAFTQLIAKLESALNATKPVKRLCATDYIKEEYEWCNNQLAQAIASTKIVVEKKISRMKKVFMSPLHRKCYIGRAHVAYE